MLVGAPANDWTHLFAGFVWNEQALFNTPGAHLPPSKLAAVQAATLAHRAMRWTASSTAWPRTRAAASSIRRASPAPRAPMARAASRRRR